MEINTAGRPLPGVPRKSLDNPARSKAYASDDECAALFDALLQTIPADLEACRSPFPILSALIDHDAAAGTDVARELVFLAAATHRTADERRTAEFLLRNRWWVESGERSALEVLLAARCSAEMDVRRVQWREPPVSYETMASWSEQPLKARHDEPSVGEMVVAKLRSAIDPVGISSGLADRLLDAVAITMELAERHALNGGTGPSILAMRADARRDARLVTHLRPAYESDTAAASVARLLVGADHTPVETSLLWWCVHPDLDVSEVPAAIRGRWSQYLRTAERALARSGQPASRPSVAGYPQAIAS